MKLIDTLIKHKMVDYIKVGCFRNYLTQIGDVRKEQHGNLVSLLGMLNFQISPNSCVQSLVTCSFKEKRICSIHILILMKVTNHDCSLPGCVDWQGEYKKFFKIHNLMRKFYIEYINFNDFPHPDIYIQCSANDKLRISLVGGDGQHWCISKIFDEKYILIPRMFDGAEIGIVYQIPRINDAHSLYNICFKKVREIDTKEN